MLRKQILLAPPLQPSPPLPDGGRAMGEGTGVRFRAGEKPRCDDFSAYNSPAQSVSAHLRRRLSMLRPVVLRSFLAVSLCAAGAAHAGIVYVPSPGLAPVGGSTYEGQISITNTAAAPGDVQQALLATNSDGTQRPTPPATVTVQPGKTAIGTTGAPPPGPPPPPRAPARPGNAGSAKPGAPCPPRGERTGGTAQRYAARLPGTGPGRLGVYLPVITSDNLIAGGKTIYLQGLLG